jgi:ATP-binding cassette, subfamily B (MDR/TAP), member 1
MFVMLAVFVGLSYFALGWSTSQLAFHITHHYRLEYFTSILSHSVAFFDSDSNSTGALTARLATDPSQLQELLGTNMAFVLISVLNVVGCLILSFLFGWKLTIITLCTSMPVIIAAAFFRIRYETQFEKMSNEVFAESAKFATESITAFRTVSSLVLEDTICERYERLLGEHVRKAFGKASWTTLVFAVADSVSLLCMAFVMWYVMFFSHGHEPVQQCFRVLMMPGTAVISCSTMNTGRFSTRSFISRCCKAGSGRVSG